MKTPPKEGSILTIVQPLATQDDAAELASSIERVLIIDQGAIDVRAARYGTRSTVPKLGVQLGPVAALVVEVKAVVIFEPTLVEKGRVRDEELPLTSDDKEPGDGS